MKTLSKKGLIIVCAVLVISVLLGTASVFAANAIIESKSIGVDKALTAALEAKELVGADVEEASVKLRVRDGVAVYVVKLETETVKYTVIINATSGEVIEVTEKELVKPEKPQETAPSDNSSNEDAAPETEEETQNEGKKPHKSKHHGKGHGKGSCKRPSSDKGTNDPLPKETTDTDVTA